MADVQSLGYVAVDGDDISPTARTERLPTLNFKRTTAGSLRTIEGARALSGALP
ncbi:MAG: hypothetical protein WBM54_02935 [Woeseia sp.]